MSYCNWEGSSIENVRYHDEEWGVPVFDDRKQFEYLMMEVMQCGLSWNLMITRREIFRACFDHFDYEKVADYGEDDIARIMNHEGMIRSERKIRAIINNARCFIRIRDEFGSFSDYLWNYTGHKTILYDKHNEGYIPAANHLSDVIAKDLKKRGFSFLGSITIYAHLQAAGLINDHDCRCERFKYIVDNYPVEHKRRYREKGIHYYGD